jgi:hypothetical protein
MKQLIMNVLEDMSGGQINLESKAARKTVANTIVAAIKTNKKGWFLDIGSIDGKPKLTKEELETQRAKETWVCSICGESTYDVDYDYIGSGTNHLGCELKSQEEIKDFIEDIDEQAYAQGRGSSYDNLPEGLKRAKELSAEAIEEGMRRTKNDMQLEHEDKVFDTAGEEVEPINTYFTADVRDERDLEDQKFGGDTGTDADFNIGQSEEIDGAYTAEEFEEWEEAVKKEETKFDPEKKYIFESPDGGETVYRREFGSDERVKIKIEEMEK